MSLRDNELARRSEGRLELRPGPLRVRWSFNDLLTSDGHELHAVFTASARAVPEAADRKMLEEVLLGPRYSLSDDHLTDHFEPALRSAAAKCAQLHTAEQWVGDDLAPQMIETLRKAAAPVAFGCGVELLAPFQIDLQSPTFQRQRLRSMQQALAERQTADQIQHVQRSAQLLSQFQAIRQAAPELSPGRVLQQISPGDRAAVLQALLLAGAKPTEARALWAVAGPYLVQIDAQSDPPQPRLFPLSPTLGPLRSIQPAQIEGQRRLILGARSGLLVFDPAHPADPQLFSDAALDSPLGFNRALYWPGRHAYVASHSEAGIVSWHLDQPAQPAAKLSPQRLGLAQPSAAARSDLARLAGPHNLQLLDDVHLIFSAGGKLFLTDLDEVQAIESESPAEIIAIVPDQRRLIIVHEDGTLCALDRQTRGCTCIGQRNRRLRSAGALPWLGASRLLLAGDEGPLDCVGFDDALVTEYQSVHRGLRQVTGSAELIAAISADRQRLVLWQTWDGRKPLAELYLTGLTRHRVADVSFG